MARPTLRRGSRGSAVKSLQTTLNSFAQYFERPDFSVGVVDGIYGAKMSKGIQSFQYAVNITPDGVVGPQTWAAVDSVGIAVFERKNVAMKPPLGASQMAVAARTQKAAPKLPPPPGGFDLASLTGDMDWKLMGVALVLGLGALYAMKGKI